MVSMLLILVVAIVIGIVAGLMPGIGMAMVVIAAIPILKSMTIPQVFFFYVVLDSTMQYYGSISSVVFGVMGETTSAPAVENGHALFRAGHGNSVLAATATSSFLGSILGIAVFWICSMYSEILITLLSGKVKVAMLMSVLLILAWLTKHRIISLIMISIGLIVGSAGSDIITWVRVFFPQYSMFDGGVPFAPLLTGFIVVPTLWHYIQHKPQVDDAIKLEQVSAKERIALLLNLQHFASTIRGSIIGCFCGAIPGVSFSISSNLAEAVEKFLHKKSTSKEAMTKNILAAEAANNSGAIVVLAPLLLFAIPILPSEAMILGIVETQGFNYSTGLTFISSNLPIILGIMVGINVINWLLSGYCYKYVSDIYNLMGNYAYASALVLCTVIVLISGYADHQFLLSIYVFLASTVCGFIIRDISVKMTFVFAFFVAADLMPELYRQYLVYFT